MDALVKVDSDTLLKVVKLSRDYYQSPDIDQSDLRRGEY